MELTITTKFDIGDEAFFRSHGEICSGIVYHVQTTCVKTEGGLIYIGVIYRLKTRKGEIYMNDFWEKRLHASKEELLNKSNE